MHTPSASYIPPSPCSSPSAYISTSTVTSCTSKTNTLPDSPLQLPIAPPRHPARHLHVDIRALGVPRHHRPQQGQLDCVAAVESGARGRATESVCEYCVCGYGGMYMYFPVPPPLSRFLGWGIAGGGGWGAECETDELRIRHSSLWGKCDVGGRWDGVPWRTWEGVDVRSCWVGVADMEWGVGDFACGSLCNSLSSEWPYKNYKIRWVEYKCEWQYKCNTVQANMTTIVYWLWHITSIL